MNATASSQTGCSDLASAPELCPYGAPAAATSPPAFVNKPYPFSNSYQIFLLLNLTNTTELWQSILGIAQESGHTTQRHAYSRTRRGSDHYPIQGLTRNLRRKGTDRHHISNVSSLIVINADHSVDQLVIGANYGLGGKLEYSRTIHGGAFPIINALIWRRINLGCKGRFNLWRSYRRRQRCGCGLHRGRRFCYDHSCGGFLVCCTVCRVGSTGFLKGTSSF